MAPDTETLLTEDTEYIYSYEQETIQVKITFKVKNGAWNDGTEEAKTVTLEGYKGQTLFPQRRMKNLLGRDICLDIDADDETGKEYNVEVQRADKGADRKRARYHSSILDAHLLQPGDDFSDLPETFVIFITENDVIGRGKPLYRVERRIEETNETFDDDEHIIYVNGADKDASTALGKLMHDFFCTDPDDMHYKELAEKVRYFKEDEKGVAAMCKVMEDMRNKAEMDGAKKAEERTTVNHISDIMDSFGVTMEKAMEALKIPASQWENYASLVGKKTL